MPILQKLEDILQWRLDKLDRCRFIEGTFDRQMSQSADSESDLCRSLDIEPVLGRSRLREKQQTDCAGERNHSGAHEHDCLQRSTSAKKRAAVFRTAAVPSF